MEQDSQQKWKLQVAQSRNRIGFPPSLCASGLESTLRYEGRCSARAVAGWCSCVCSSVVGSGQAVGSRQ